VLLKEMSDESFEGEEEARIKAAYLAAKKQVEHLTRSIEALEAKKHQAEQVLLARRREFDERSCRTTGSDRGSSARRSHRFAEGPTDHELFDFVKPAAYAMEQVSQSGEQSAAASALQLIAGIKKPSH
jgi:hypothetical protein